VALRDAHEAVGRAVHLAIDPDRELSDLDLAKLQVHRPAIEAEVFTCLTVEGSVGARDHLGGTASAQVCAAISRARANLSIP
jgi:argininosuccinate lyase